MKTHPNEVLVLYHEGSNSARQTLAYAHTLSKHVRELDYGKLDFTSTMWKRLLFQLSLEPKELLDKSNDYYQNNIRGRSFDDEGWLNIIRRNPQLIKAPIVIKGDKAMLCMSPSDVFKVLKEEVPEAPSPTGL